MAVIVLACGMKMRQRYFEKKKNIFSVHFDISTVRIDKLVIGLEAFLRCCCCCWCCLCSCCCCYYCCCWSSETCWLVVEEVAESLELKEERQDHLKNGNQWLIIEVLNVVIGYLSPNELTIIKQLWFIILIK